MLLASGCGQGPGDAPNDVTGSVQAAVTGTGLVATSLTTVPTTSRVFFADVTGDQATDLLLLDPTRVLEVRKAINTSSGLPSWETTTSEQTVLLASDITPPILTVMDFNGDGRSDMMQRLSDGTEQLWLRNSAGNGWIKAGDPTGVAISSGHGSPSEAAFGDFDGDGDVDAAQVRNGKASFWKFGPSGSGWAFDRDAGSAWDVTFPPPLAKNATYTPLSQITGNFFGDRAAELGLIARSENPPASEVTMFSVTSRTPTSNWVTGFGTAPEVAIADLNGDGFSDFMQLADSGGISVWRGGGANGVSVSAPTSFFGSPPSRAAFANLDGSGNLDLVRFPFGQVGDIDVWLGTGSSTAPYFGSGASWATFNNNATIGEFAAIQGQTWGTGTRVLGPQEIGVRMGGVVYLFSAGSPPPPPSGAIETRIAAGFKQFLQTPDGLSGQKYPTEGSMVELSAWRFTRGDAALQRAVADYDRIAMHVGDNTPAWMASDGNWPANDANGTTDEQARQVINFYTGYLVLGYPRLLTDAENSLDALLVNPKFTRLKYFASGACTVTAAGNNPLSCSTFVSEGGHADPNQNVEIALAFALLEQEPNSKFYTQKLPGGDIYTLPDGSNTSISISDVIGSEMQIAYHAQNAGVVNTGQFAGGLLMDDRSFYLSQNWSTNPQMDFPRDACNGTIVMPDGPPTGSYDTAYGAYALFNSVWLDRVLTNDSWYNSGLKAWLQPKITLAANWLNRYSRSNSLTFTSPVSYHCHQCNRGNCFPYSVNNYSTLSVVEWDAWYRVPVLNWLNGHQSTTGTCPDQLLSPTVVPVFADYAGFQPLEQALLMGVRRSFFSQGC